MEPELLGMVNWSEYRWFFVCRDFYGRWLFSKENVIVTKEFGIHLMQYIELQCNNIKKGDINELSICIENLTKIA